MRMLMKKDLQKSPHALTYEPPKEDIQLNYTNAVASDCMYEAGRWKNRGGVKVWRAEKQKCHCIRLNSVRIRVRKIIRGCKRRDIVTE